MITFLVRFLWNHKTASMEMMTMVTYKGKHDEERLVVQIRLGEERQPKVDKDKVL